MSSVQCLRLFVSERLTAAAEEIVKVFEKTIVEYEEEIARQRKLLDIVWKPEVKLHRIEVPQQYVCEEEEEEVPVDQQLSYQEMDSSPDQEDPEPVRIKEEEEELCTSHKGEQLDMNTFMLTTTYEGSDSREKQGLHLNADATKFAEEKESVVSLPLILSVVSHINNDHHLLSQNSREDDSLDYTAGRHGDSMSNSNAEPLEEQQEINIHTDNVNNFPLSDSHNNDESRKKSVKCDICGKVYKYESKLSAHLRSHTGEKPYFCKICAKRFSDPSAFKRHILTHTGEKPYLCNICGKKFFRKSSLKSHLRTHTGERPYFCHTCGKSFSQASGLNVHFKIHTGEKPYTCKTCGRCFRRNHVLQLHMRTHTGEKPYLCKTCGKRFNDTSGLKRHMKVHKDEQLHSQTSELKVEEKSLTSEIQ